MSAKFPTLPLPSEINDDETEERVEAAFEALYDEMENIEAVYEHGRWWIMCEDPNEDYLPRTYAVVDAEGPDDTVADGFSFEEL